MALVRSETLLLAEAATAACLTCVPGLLLSAAYASFQLLAFNREGKEPSALAPRCVMHYERQRASKVQHLANQLLVYFRSEITSWVSNNGLSRVLATKAYYGKHLYSGVPDFVIWCARAE